MKAITGLEMLSPCDELSSLITKQRAYVQRIVNGGISARCKKTGSEFTVSELDLQRKWLFVK